MTWLLIAISAYLILAIVFLVDKHLLITSIPNPKVYTFYVGTLGISVLILIPFTGFFIPSNSQIVISLLAGSFFIYGIYWLYRTLKNFEPSRVIPAVGGLTPLITFGLIYFYTSGQEVLSFNELLAFGLLIIGSVLITYERKKIITLKSFLSSFITAFFLSLSFVLTKYIYLAQPFWNGFIWRSIGGFLLAILFFVIFPDIRKEIFKKKKLQNEKPKRSGIKTAIIFLTNQAAGASAAILQNYSIALAPLVYVPVIQALNGTQYFFLLILATLISLKFPQILKEEVSKQIIIQKIIAVLFIIIGLAVLVFKLDYNLV